MLVRLTHIDGKFPNLALMKLAHWHNAAGDQIAFSKSLTREMFEPEYDVVYGSTIFAFSHGRLDTFREQWPAAIVGGTGTDSFQTVEEFLGVPEYEHYDYSIYPTFPGSIGFTARGCRLRCGFCVVSKKEGKPRATNTVYDLWRGDPHPRHLHLLDNDFFGQPAEQWQARVREILDGKFKVSFTQGINIRLISEEAAEYLGILPYYDDQFKSRRLYTAWDNLKDEKLFFKGVSILEKHGVPPRHLMVYMLVGYDPTETMERIMYRFNRMVEIGIKPYPMVYNNADPNLKRFQRWVVRRYYKFIPFEEYNASIKTRKAETGQIGLI